MATPKDETQSQIAIKHAMKKHKELFDAEARTRKLEDRRKKNELRDGKAAPYWAQLNELIEEKLIGANALKGYESWQTSMGNVSEAAWQLFYALQAAQPLPRIAQSIVNVPLEFDAKLGISDAIKNTGRRGLAALYLVDPKLETWPNLKTMISFDDKGMHSIKVSAFKDGKELPLGDAANEMQEELRVGMNLYMKSEGYVLDKGIFKKAGVALNKDSFSAMLAHNGGLLATLLSEKTGLDVEPSSPPRMR